MLQDMDSFQACGVAWLGHKYVQEYTAIEKTSGPWSQQGDEARRSSYCREQDWELRKRKHKWLKLIHLRARVRPEVDRGMVGSSEMSFPRSFSVPGYYPGLNHSQECESHQCRLLTGLGLGALPPDFC